LNKLFDLKQLQISAAIQGFESWQTLRFDTGSKTPLAQFTMHTHNSSFV
jgi:hypothetical protein